MCILHSYLFLPCLENALHFSLCAPEVSVLMMLPRWTDSLTGSPDALSPHCTLSSDTGTFCSWILRWMRPFLYPGSYSGSSTLSAWWDPAGTVPVCNPQKAGPVSFLHRPLPDTASILISHNARKRYAWYSGICLRCRHLNILLLSAA